VVCARCGSQAEERICPACGAAVAFAPPRANTDASSDSGAPSPDARSLRAAGTLQLILSVLYAVAGVISYFRGLRPSGGPIIYVIFFFGVTLWFVASLQVRQRYRWAWRVSIGIAAFLVALMAYRIGQGIITGGQIVVPVILFIIDVVLLLRGRRGLR